MASAILSDVLWVEHEMGEREGASLRINDLVVLGRSSPDTLMDRRVSVCVAGYSMSQGFVRLYPTRMDSPLRVWNIVSVPVERNERDQRAESWKVQGSKSGWDTLSHKIRLVGRLGEKSRPEFVGRLVSGCVKELIDNDRSLGIIRPHTKECYLGRRNEYEPGVQMTLSGASVPKDKHGYELQPRIHYFCSECRSQDGHDQQLLEWGVYEWMRKNPGREEKVWDNLFARESQQEILFLVGNQARWRHSYMIISVLRLRTCKMKGQRSLTENPI